MQYVDLIYQIIHLEHYQNANECIFRIQIYPI